jgi:hypothetical protein
LRILSNSARVRRSWSLREAISFAASSSGERVGELAWPHRVALPNCALVVASAALRFRV